MLHRLVLLSLLLPFSIASIAANTTALLGGGVCINEFLADPNGTNNFDTDGSGAANTEDEFVELYNLSGVTIDIGGWQLWDQGLDLWFTFPGGTMLGPGNFAVVIIGVQAGGSLPMVSGGNLVFDAGITGGVVNNGGDNIVLYDPGADEFVQLIFNGDSTNDPTNPADGYASFSATATRIGAVEDFGNDTDGLSRVRSPAGDTNVTNATANMLTPGFPVELKSFIIE